MFCHNCGKKLPTKLKSSHRLVSGTRSMIGIEAKNGTVLAIYCQFDGYPEYNGVVLSRQFNTRAKVSELIMNGSIDALSTDGLKRPRLGSKIYHYNNIQSYLQLEETNGDHDGDGSYLYIFTKENKWLYGDWNTIDKIFKKNVNPTDKVCKRGLKDLNKAVANEEDKDTVSF